MAFQTEFVQGNFAQANTILDKQKRPETGNQRLLHFMQKGVTLHLLENFDESNAYFEKGYIYLEDYRKNNAIEAASFLVNPTIKPYVGEDHEKVLIHYYKSLNYLRTNRLDESMVEARRINLKLNVLNDRYEKKKNRYNQDAFAHNLIGLNYDALGDDNNAFIAYRNAYDAYVSHYSKHFGTNAPVQLQKDLIRTAEQSGFVEEAEKYREETGIKESFSKANGGDLILFWNNGLGPVKSEWSVNFFIVKGQGGMVLFVNEELGLSLPFPMPSNGSGGNGLGDLKFVRVAFPKYLERKPYYRSAAIKVDGKSYPLELGENINEIAFKTLEDRMVRELSTALMRLALKQAAEAQLRKQNENLGALLSVVNAVSEKADTRNWQTLPYSISYARIPLKPGENSLKFVNSSPNGSRSKEEELVFNGKPGHTQFHSIHSLTSLPIEQ